MIRHNLQTASSAFRKAPFTTAANVLTLALGLACFIAAWSIATYWRSADGYHQDAGRIVTIGQSLARASDPEPAALRLHSTATLAKYLRQDVPQLEQVARLLSFRQVGVAANDTKLSLDAAVVDPAFLDIFDFTFLAGDPRRALADPGSVLLTKHAAERLFAGRPAVGQTIRLPEGVQATVTGVIAPVRQPSFMGTATDSVVPFDLLLNWSSTPSATRLDENDFWRGFNAMTFARMAPGVPLEALNARFPAFVERRMPALERSFLTLKVEAFPVAQMTTRALDSTLFGKNALGLTVAATLLALGMLILAVACVNYANLAAAQTAVREREFAMRKVLGAGRAAVMAQLWLESLIQAGCAAALAIAVLVTLAPFVRNSANVDLLHIFAQGPLSWASLGVLVMAVTLVCAAYPAFALYRVRPISAVKSIRGGSRGFAKVLVGIQFASASFLLIFVSVAHLQREEMERTALAGLNDPVISLGDIRSLGIDYETLEAQLLQSPAIKSVTVSEFVPWSGSANLGAFARSPEPTQTAPDANYRWVGFDYFETLGLPLLAGRSFEKGRDAPTLLEPGSPEDYDVILDREFAAHLGFPTPQAAVGQTIYVPANSAAPARPLHIIGVTETQVQNLAAGDGAGSVYVLATNAPHFGQIPLVRISAENTAAGMAQVERVWDQIAPQAPLRAMFYDELFELAYRRHAQLSNLFILLAGVTFAIASTGILGIAVHVATRRRREVAVRKVLGSTTWEAVWLLLSDFSKPVVVANLIAWPAGYLAAEAYLSAFAHRIDLTPWPFVFSMIITLAIAWLAVGGQTFKAASIPPAQVLKDA